MYKLRIGDKFTKLIDYKIFIKLVSTSKFIITNSVGMQEETTWLRIPCLTLRESTERPSTVRQGTNTIIGNNFELLNEKINEILEGKYKKGTIPELWDGKASQRIVKEIIKNNKEFKKMIEKMLR